MTMSAKIAGICGSVFLICAPVPAFADATTGQSSGPNPEASVDLGTSPINRMSAKYDTDNYTCKTSWSTALWKTIKTRKTGNIAVHYEQENFKGCRLLLRLRVDGVVAPGPGDAASPFASHDTNSELSTNGFNWAVRKVKAGTHRIEVQCQCIAAGKSNTVDEREMIVYHR